MVLRELGTLPTTPRSSNSGLLTVGPMIRPLLIAYCITLASVNGCIPVVPPEALSLQPEALSLRRLQTRRFDTNNETELLRASVSVLQDLGFEIDESESRLGVLVASKDRDATNPLQITGVIIIGALGGGRDMPVDRNQKIRASLVTRVVSPRESVVRVTFQRTVWNDRGEVSLAEALSERELYQEFFSKLSKSLFLEAHGI